MNSLLSIVAQLAAALATTAAPLPAETYGGVQVSLDYAAVAQRGLGPKRSGMLCMPTGAMRWQDVAPGGDAASQALFGQLVAGSALARPGRLARPIALAASITDMEVKGCSKKYFMGSLGRFNGEGQVAVEWALHQATSTRSVTTMTRFKFEQAQISSGDILERAIAAALVDVATKLEASP